MRLDFLSDIILENAHVLLRPLVASDFNELLPFSLNEPELWFYSLVSGAGEDNLQNYMQYALGQKEKQTSYPFLVIDKVSGRVAGSTRFYDYQEHHNTIQLGFTWYGEKFQRTELNKNCKYLLLEYAFETLNLSRVEFRADKDNQRSILAMKSIGCTEEGILRSNCVSPNGRRDSIVLSILKSEWREEIKNRLAMRIG